MPSARTATERVARSHTDARALVLGVLGVALCVALAWFALRQDAAEPPQRATVDGDLPTAVGDWRGAQLRNAAIVMEAGRDLGASERDVRIAVMTAMGESSLRILDHGDTAGPDSRGLFQQRDSWGSLEMRMDAYDSATLFYRALDRVRARDVLPPTRVAHAVQINRDPEHYARWWDDAGEVVAAIDGSDAAVVVR